MTRTQKLKGLIGSMLVLATSVLVTVRITPTAHAAPSSPVFISEIVADNSASTIYPTSDWIEIANVGPTTEDLGGWKLRDGGSIASATWTFPPSTLIVPEERLVVWANPLLVPPIGGSGLNTTFGLSRNGEALTLLRPDGTIAHAFLPAFPALAQNQSYGIDSDGEDRFFTTPTPGVANGPGNPLVFAEKVTVSPPRGFYSTPQTIMLSTATPAATIRYTTDGSIPTATNGTTYTVPFSVDTTSVVRATAIKTGLGNAPTSTNSYLFIASVLQQGTGIPGFPNGRLTPAGWDADVGNERPVPEDTAMDPNVVNSSLYGPQLPAALSTIPSIMISSPVTGIFDQSGFYDTEDVVKPVSVELLDANNPSKNSQIDGGAESHATNYLKRSMRLNFSSAYGDPRWTTDLFRDAPLNGASAASAVKSIVLRSGHSRSWTQDTFNPAAATFTEDQFYRDSFLAMTGYGMRGTFVHVYLNGVYWGLYNATERADFDFASAYFGGNPNSYMWLKDNKNATERGVNTHGDTTRFDYLVDNLASRDMRIQSNYDELLQYLDVENFADYLVLNWWWGQTDWPYNNFYGFNRNASGPDTATPFKYLPWDGEWAWNRKINFPPTSTGAYIHEAFQPGSTHTAVLAKLWRALRVNPKFMALFHQRAALHTGPDGALNDAAARARFDTLNAYVRDAVIAESARWGDSKVSLGYPLRTRDSDWEREVGVQRAVFSGNAALLLASARYYGYYPAAETVRPTVTSTAPGNASIDAPITVRPTITFSEPVTSYRNITVAPAAGGAAVPATVTIVGSVVTVTPITSLTPATQYRISVPTTVTDLSRNALAAPFNAVFTTAAPPSPPGAPTSVVAVAGDGSAWLQWSAPASTGGSPITGYEITSFLGAVAQATVSVGSVTSTVVEGLANGTTYTFSVNAVNSVGTGEAGISNPVTPSVGATTTTTAVTTTTTSTTTTTTPPVTTTTVPGGVIATIELEDQPNTLQFEQALPGGAFGRGSLGYWYGLGTYSRFTVNVPTTGTYILRYRYSTLRVGTTRALTIDNGLPSVVAFPSTGSWAAWATIDVSVQLSAGTRTIQLTRLTTSTGEINLDRVTVLGGTPTPTTTTTPLTTTTAPTTTAPVATTTTTTDVPTTTTTTVPTTTTDVPPTTTTTAPTTTTTTTTVPPTTTTSAPPTTTTTTPGSVQIRFIELEDQPNTLQFESAAAEGGTGRGSLGYWFSVGQFSRFSFTAPSAGTYVVRLRYSTPSPGVTRRVFVDGVGTQSLLLPSTGRWGVWRTVDVPLTLTAGLRTVEFRMISGDVGAVNVDNVTLFLGATTTTSTTPATTTTSTAPATTTTTTSPTTTTTTAPTITTTTTAPTTTTTSVPGSPVAFVELEDAQHNLGFESAAAAGGTGRGSLGFWYYSNQYAGFTVTVPSTRSYVLRLRYSTPNAGVTRTVTVGGVVVTTAVLPSTGSWATWRTIDIPVTLAAGPRSIQFRMGSAAANVDNVTVL